MSTATTASATLPEGSDIHSARSLIGEHPELASRSALVARMVGDKRVRRSVLRRLRYLSRPPRGEHSLMALDLLYRHARDTWKANWLERLCEQPGDGRSVFNEALGALRNAYYNSANALSPGTRRMRPYDYCRPDSASGDLSVEEIREWILGELEDCSSASLNEGKHRLLSRQLAWIDNRKGVKK